MTFNKIPALAFLLIIISSFTWPARAADFSFFVGGELPGSVKRDGVKTALDNGPVYGFRFGNDFVEQFGIGMEHTLAFSSDYLFPSGDTSVEKARGFIYNSNLEVNFTKQLSPAVPFLTAGVGLVHQYGDRGLPVETAFAFNYGGGLKFPNLAGPLGARVDLRGYRAGVFSKKVNIFEISVGLMVSFGR